MPKTREERAEYERLWREQNPDKVAARRARYRPKAKAHQAKWISENRHKLVIYEARRRAKPERQEYMRRWREANKLKRRKQK